MGTSSNFGNMFSMAAASLFLPFLPMLPSQVLLNNFLYDLAQITIPTDNVDPSFVHKPRRWDISLIRNFMIVLGPISSLFHFLTFWALMTLFQGSEAHFHTGWFVESLATQTLVLFVIRTAGRPWRSRPSRLLTMTVLAVVFVGAALPFTPLAGPLGFARMSPAFFVFLFGIVATYLTLAELVKRRLLQKFFGYASLEARSSVQARVEVQSMCGLASLAVRRRPPLGDYPWKSLLAGRTFALACEVHCSGRSTIVSLYYLVRL